jgi:hypothetical protein
VGLAGGEFVNARPELAQGGERFGRIGAGKDEDGLVVQRAETSIEVIAVGVD